MAETTNYQCPNCMGPLHFSSETGKLQCEYCGSSFSPEEFKALNQKAVEAEIDLEENKETLNDNWGEDAEKMRVYSCPSCGAELLCEETTAATSCPYCGNPTILPGTFHGALKPDYVIPFAQNQEEAEAALKRHYKKKLLLPKVFAQENHIKEIKGIYVPFWLFDLHAEGEFKYHGSLSTTHRQGDYRVTDTRHYDLYRSGTMEFRQVPVDGSQKMPDALMDSIEPYDYTGLKEFTTAFLPGFFADKYDVNAETTYDRALERSTSTVFHAVEQSVKGYGDVRLLHHDLDLNRKNLSYALLPVWLLTTRWKDETYLFAMNGQTGKMVGDLPVDPKKRALLFFGSFLGLSLLLCLTLAAPLGHWLCRLVMEFF